MPLRADGSCPRNAPSEPQNVTVLVGSGCCDKIPQAGRLEQQTFISCSFGGWKSEIKVQADLVPGEGPFPGFTGQRERDLESAFLKRTLLPSRGPTLMTS